MCVINSKGMAKIDENFNAQNTLFLSKKVKKTKKKLL